MISEDEYLERVVAGIHAVTTTGAEVTWNEVINGRQFDVVVRFSLGTLRYLVLVEVKNRVRRAAAGDMDAFVLKARDQNANKSVFVTAAGFQEGAIVVARRHGVDLFTVTFDEANLQLPTEGSLFVREGRVLPGQVRAEISVGDPRPVIQVKDVTLVYGDGRRFELPSEQSQMSYYAARTRLKDGTSLEKIFAGSLPLSMELGEERWIQIPLKRAQRIDPPDEYFFPAGKLARLECLIAGTMSRPITGSARVEPSALQAPVVYTNVITGEESRFPLNRIPLATGPVLAGSFYFMPHPLRYYHCASIDGDLVTWDLVESFQNEQLITGTYTQKIEYARHYVPISDRRTLARLRGRLADYDRRRGASKDERKR